MKYLSSFLLFLSISLSSFSQQFDWATTSGYLAATAENYGAPADVAVDPFGNVYTIFSASETQECQGVIAAPLSAGTNSFLHKLNSLGELSYLKVIGGDQVALNLEVDEIGNIYVLFKAASTQIIFDGVSTPVIAQRNYILKLDLAGEFVWLHDTGYNQNARVGMFEYSNGFLYYQSSNLSIGKIDVEGNVVNALSPTFYQSVFGSFIRFRGSAVCPNGDLLFAACTFGDISYGTDTLIAENVSVINNPNLYLRTDADFNIIYATYIQGLREPIESKIPVCVDAQGDVFTAIQVGSTTQIGSDVFSGDFGNYSNVVAKIDANGTPVWGRAAVDPVGSRIWAMTETTDNSGVLFTGNYSFNVQFGSQVLSVVNSTSFICKIDTNGDFIYVKDIVSNVSSRPSAIVNDGINYFIAGRLSATAFQPLFSCIPAVGNEAHFAARISDQPGTSFDCVGPIPGCTDPTACNFSSSATVDNGSCTFPRYFIPSNLNGGPIILACNNPGGNYELAGSQSCIAAITVNDPFCINTNWDQLCFDAYEECAVGCTDSSACNFDPGALTDDGSCSYPGCNNPAACNFDPTVLCNDGSCIVPPAPTIDDFTPQQIACSGDFVLSILGTDFCGLTDVLINGQSCVINSSTDNLINCSTVAGTGTVSLEVITVHGSTSTSISYLPPVIEALSLPSSPCEGGLLMQISGTDLCEATEVIFGDLSVPVVSASSSIVEVVIPAGFESLDVRVVSPSGTSNPLPFSYQLPFINAISVVQFSCTGGESVTVGGISLCDPVSVLINGVEQTVISSSSTSVEFITPPAIGGEIARLKVVSNGFTSNQLIFNYVGHGCTNPLAINFDPTAVCDNGFCVILPDNSDCPADINFDGQINTGDLNALLSVYGSICP